MQPNAKPALSGKYSRKQRGMGCCAGAAAERTTLTDASKPIIIMVIRAPESKTDTKEYAGSGKTGGSLP